MNNPIKFIFFIFLGISVFYISSCKKNKSQVIIPREKFIQIVTDLHYADALITNRGISGLQTNDSLPAYYHYILKKYDFTKNNFDVSLAYYSEDMEDLLEIYDEVIHNINNQIPKKLNEKSIYKIFDLALEEAKIRNNPDSWLGPDGKPLWTETKTLFIINKDSLVSASFEGKLKFRSLLMLQSEVMLFPEDSSKNLRMYVKINYTDSSSAIAEKPLAKGNGDWIVYQIFLKPDSLKNPKSVECSVFKCDTLYDQKHGKVKNILLKQYPYNKDTALLIKKEIHKPQLLIERNQPLHKKNIENSRSSRGVRKPNN